jgi:hypothetical protein
MISISEWFAKKFKQYPLRMIIVILSGGVIFFTTLIIYSIIGYEKIFNLLNKSKLFVIYNIFICLIGVPITFAIVRENIKSTKGGNFNFFDKVWAFKILALLIFLAVFFFRLFFYLLK